MTQNKEKTASNDESSQQEKFFVPDYSELWKEWYFRMEDIWSETFRQFITTKSFGRRIGSDPPIPASPGGCREPPLRNRCPG
jgi:hypothetical protein